MPYKSLKNKYLTKMMLLKTVLLSLVLFVGIISAKSQEENDFVDKVISDIKTKHKNNLEPIQLPEHKFLPIEKRIGLIHFKIETKIYDGAIYGIGSTLKRVNNSEVIEQKDDYKIYKVILSVGVLNYQYKAAVTFNELGKPAKFSGTIKHAKIEMNVKNYNQTGKLFIKHGNYYCTK